jgi:Mn-dependent DtxR family transcriptional regulator
VPRLNITKAAYIEAIHALINKQGYAAVTDIAKTLNVKPASVTEMLKKLDPLGLVEYIPYRHVSLTPKGKEIAVVLEQGNLSIQSFLKLLDVDEQIAQKDACKAKHVLHTMTLQRLEQFTAYVQSTPQGTSSIGNFKKYRSGQNQQTA